MPRTFTIEEARALLPEVRSLVQALRDAKQQLDLQRSLVQAAGEHAGGNGHGPRDAVGAQREAERLVTEMQASLDRITELGVEIKGIDEGLADFPSIREGRTVYLCWRLGEDDIRWWHELDTGFGGRQPL